jgi:hypothetical protein
MEKKVLSCCCCLTASLRINIYIWTSATTLLRSTFAREIRPRLVNFPFDFSFDWLTLDDEQRLQSAAVTSLSMSTGQELSNITSTKNEISYSLNRLVPDDLANCSYRQTDGHAKAAMYSRVFRKSINLRKVLRTIAWLLTSINHGNRCNYVARRFSLVFAFNAQQTLAFFFIQMQENTFEWTSLTDDHEESHWCYFHAVREPIFEYEFVPELSWSSDSKMDSVGSDEIAKTITKTFERERNSRSEDLPVLLRLAIHWWTDWAHSRWAEEIVCTVSSEYAYFDEVN